jgi:hypothetical protein
MGLRCLPQPVLISVAPSEAGEDRFLRVDSSTSLVPAPPEPPPPFVPPAVLPPVYTELRGRLLHCLRGNPGWVGPQGCPPTAHVPALACVWE